VLRYKVNRGDVTKLRFQNERESHVFVSSNSSVLNPEGFCFRSRVWKFTGYSQFPTSMPGELQVQT
jgi:hypothetical protein